MITNDNILIINSNSFIGKSIVNRLERNNYNNIIINNDLDLTNEKAIDFFIKKQKPDIIFICFNNLFLQDKFINICNNYTIKTIIRFSNEKTNTLSKNILISYYTDNVYGVEDNFDIAPKNGNCFNEELKDKHIISELFRRIYEAKISKIPLLYFKYKYNCIHYIHIEDLLNHLFKIGLTSKTTTDFKILEKNTITNLISLISEIVEYDGRVVFNDNINEIESYKINSSLKIKLLSLYRDLRITNKYFILN